MIGHCSVMVFARFCSILVNKTTATRLLLLAATGWLFCVGSAPEARAIIAKNSHAVHASPSHPQTTASHKRKMKLRGCLSGGPVIAMHGRKLGAIGAHGRLLAPVGRAIYYTDGHQPCIPGKHVKRRG